MSNVRTESRRAGQAKNQWANKNEYLRVERSMIPEEQEFDCTLMFFKTNMTLPISVASKCLMTFFAVKYGHE